MFGYETYLSPLTWRYGSAEMRCIWSEEYKRRLWRRIWLALAEAQESFGLVTAEQVADLHAHVQDVDMERSQQIEAEIKHDLMSEVKAFAEQCPVGGGIIHLGATSMDIEDNADALRLCEALDLLLAKLHALLGHLAELIETWADHACMGYTHLQPAEPTTIGYRLAQYGLDLLIDLRELNRVRKAVRGKGFKGATGTSASYTQLLSGSVRPPGSENSPRRIAPGRGDAPKGTKVGRARELESRIMAQLGLQAFPVSTQTYPRKQDWLVLNAVAGLAGSLYKFAFDLRILQSQPFGEWSEPFDRRQVGSSAMPFKRNPIHAENLDSLARLVAALPRVAWDNAAHSLLERTLDDKSNRRLILPQAFLLTDELVRRTRNVFLGLVIRESAVSYNLEVYGTFAATERLLMELVKAGADRQAMHEVIRRHCLDAWDALQQSPSSDNPLAEQLAAEPAVLAYLPAGRVRNLLSAGDYVGDAPERAREMAAIIRQARDNPPFQ